MRLQKLTQTSREKNAMSLLAKLKNCREEFLAFAKQEWITQCKKTSNFNILDQHFKVAGEQRLTVEKSNTTDDKNEDADDAYDHVELRDDEEMQEEEISDGDTETVIYDISEFIYMLAIADSKKEVDKAIRKRRSDILETRATAAALKAKQADVDARADSMLPADIAVTLANKFAQSNFL